MTKLQAPFPYFGGKSKIAGRVWNALGQTKLYLEPFFGSGAVLLARPHYNKEMKEIVCDIDGFVCNAWRAIQFAPEETAKHCDWPINHLDLIARKRELIRKENYLIEGLKDSPKFFDVELGGYWIWCASNSIGIWTCMNQIPDIGAAPKGVVKKSKREKIYKWINQLSRRLRYVNIIYGEWNKILGGNWQTRYRDCGIFFDPPYGVENRSEVYKHDSKTLTKKVLKYCIEKGNNKDYKIVLCGYNEYEELINHDWRKENWIAHGGLQCIATKNKNKNKNNERETIWYSPYCSSGTNINNFLRRKEK